MTRRAGVIGLDGAAWHLLDPLVAAGLMPRLAGLRSRGASGTLVSTVPTYTPPAWTSAATGANPGRHGIYGFVTGNAQSESRGLVHAGRIRAPTIWEIANAQGATVGVYNLPLTYPPQPLDGWMISGMMTPGYGERLTGFSYPRGLESEIARWAPGYVVDVSANYERDWRDARLCQRALASIRQRRVVLERLLDEHEVDIVFAVLEAPDRLQHVYYRYLDPSDPAYESEPARRLRPAVADCFAALDEICGILADWAGDGGVIVCSDHGFTAWDVSVHLNTLLSRWGYLELRPAARAVRTRAVRALVPVARRVLPRRFARDVKNRTFAAVDWTRTRAFASPIPMQGVIVNVAGRERFGCVPRDHVDAVKDDLVERFMELRGPDGRPVTDRVWRSEEVFVGDQLDGAPDLLPVLRDHRFELDDELFHTDPFSDVSHLPRGVHHPDGIVVVAGPGVTPGTEVGGGIADVTPTLLYMAGLAVPDGLDGTVLPAFDEGYVARHPVGRAAPISSRARGDTSPYSEEEEALIEESLRGLGYL